MNNILKIRPRTANRELRTFVFLLLSILLFTWSCEENFDINAPYQDITVVFGLLDPGEDTIFLKINKAFLGDGNVLEMAKIEDSSSYVNGLQASIEEWENGDFIKSYPLDTITVKNKEQGFFYNPYQIIYYTPYEPATSREYRLKVEVNNKEITAVTNLVNDFSILKPTAGSNSIQFTKGVPGKIEWESAKHGKRYEVMMRIKYKEVLLNSPDTLYKYIDWGMGTKKSVSDKGGEELKIEFSNEGFYTLISNEIPYSDLAMEANVKERHTNDVDFIIAVAALDLNTYMEVNEPSNSIIQERPEYTNISNGIGLFSSRYKKIRTKKIGNITIQTIKTDPLTANLKFID
ncbi:MAG: hypothetical protein M0Q51_11255 [Bacteroidales bacterium]|nr:hypothetical protein [Bacteroidales bacterium]